MQQHYDLIIVGGGLVGASLAAALTETASQKGQVRRIALIDALPPRQDDPRLFALNHSSCQLFKNLHLWPELLDHATPIKAVHVTHQGHFGVVRLDANEVALSELGHVVPAYVVEQALNRRLQDNKHIDIYQPCTLLDVQEQENCIELNVCQEDTLFTLHADIVIAADGSRSTVRKQLPFTIEKQDYQQSALVARTTIGNVHQNIAHERFNTDGAIAMLPLANQSCATIWTGKTEFITPLAELTSGDFMHALQDTFGGRLGKIESVSKRHIYPLNFLRVCNPVYKRCMLIGNAAHTMHPIAAQGFNVALYEVALLAETIANAKGRLNPTHLQRVGDSLAKQTSNIQFSHRLSQLYARRFPFKNMALTMGMVTLDALTPLKTRLLNRLIGRTAKRPALML